MKKIILISFLFLFTQFVNAQGFIDLQSPVTTSKGQFGYAKVTMAWTQFADNSVSVRLEWALYVDTIYSPADYIYSEYSLTPEQITQFGNEIIPTHLPLLYSAPSGQGYSSKHEILSDTTNYKQNFQSMLKELELDYLVKREQEQRLKSELEQIQTSIDRIRAQMDLIRAMLENKVQNYKF